MKPDKDYQAGLILVIDYFKFVFFCFLLIVPVYAIVTSAMNQDWTMMIIDIVFIPVGLIHGLLLLLGAL